MNMKLTDRLFPNPDFDWMAHPIQHFGLITGCAGICAAILLLPVLYVFEPSFPPLILLLAFPVGLFVIVQCSLVIGAPLYYIRWKFGGGTLSWLVVYILFALFGVWTAGQINDADPEAIQWVMAGITALCVWAISSIGALRFRHDHDPTSV